MQIHRSPPELWSQLAHWSSLIAHCSLSTGLAVTVSAQHAERRKDLCGGERISPF